MMPNRQETEPYLSAFRLYQENGGGRGPAWLRKLREAGIASFEKLGFPTNRNEDWKYTSVGPLAAMLFERSEHLENDTRTVAADAIRGLSFTDSSCNRLIFVNGVYSSELSALSGLPRGVRAESLADAVRRDDDILHAHLSRYVRYQEHSFVALNTAFIEDGALVVIPKGVVVEEAIYLVFVSTGEYGPVASHPRNLIVAEEGSESQIGRAHV